MTNKCFESFVFSDWVFFWSIELQMEESRAVPPFRCDRIETGKLAKEWKKWKESLDCYFEAYGIMDQKVKRAKLLHLGGSALQTVFRNLGDHDHVPIVVLDPKYYDIAIEALDEFFEPRHQNTSERRKLRQMKQQSGERFADFIIRLKQQASECGFDRYDTEVAQVLTYIYLTDAVVEGCASNDVRKTILLKDLSFPEIERLGVSQESVDTQVEEISEAQRPGKIYKVAEQRGDRRRIGFGIGVAGRSQGKNCYNCGRLGHIAISTACPARGKQCHNCKSYGHFEKLCRKPKREMGKVANTKQVC